MIKFRIVSSLEKVFYDDNVEMFQKVNKFTAYKNQRLSFQIVATDDNAQERYTRYQVKLNGKLAKYAKFFSVEMIPSSMPVYRDSYDTNYLRTTPGLYPDLLMPLRNRNSLSPTFGQLRSFWCEFDFNGEVEEGTYDTNIEFYVLNTDECVASERIMIKVLPVSLPEQTIKVTQWFHCDCLADYYNVDVFSERHWEIINNFMKTAVKNGQNMILTPTFTPAFDTEIGGERPTVQLVDVTVENGDYCFGFEKLNRWIEICKKNGIKYYEIAPFFTQWGAKHAPKVMATVDGEYKRIFGWETDSAGEEYISFLRKFISAFVDYMKSIGEDKKCHFHISDEPNNDRLESYKALKNSVSDLIKDYYCMDALSDYDFYLKGAVDHPVAATSHITPFLEGGVEGLWCYYCCGQNIGTSNRFFSMPSARTRMLGTQMYKYNIAGFLQWGYNFYYNHMSRDLINPFVESAGEYFYPSGDGYIVYPANDGTAYESIRLKVFYEALEDMRAMQLCETLYSHDEVVAEIEKVCGEVRFDRCPHTSEEMLAIRRRIDEMVEAKI